MTSIIRYLVLGSAFSMLVQIGPHPTLDHPFRVFADGRPIDVELGRAAPCFSDLDGDGLPDLLVGQVGGGRIRIYRNVGRLGEPKFEGFTYLQAGGADASVPAG